MVEFLVKCTNAARDRGTCRWVGYRKGPKERATAKPCPLCGSSVWAPTPRNRRD